MCCCHRCLLSKRQVSSHCCRNTSCHTSFSCVYLKKDIVIIVIIMSSWPFLKDPHHFRFKVPTSTSSFLESSNLLEPRFVEDLGVGPMPLWIDRFARTLHDGREAYRRGVQDESSQRGRGDVKSNRFRCVFLVDFLFHLFEKAGRSRWCKKCVEWLVVCFYIAGHCVKLCGTIAVTCHLWGTHGLPNFWGHHEISNRSP